MSRRRRLLVKHQLEVMEAKKDRLAALDVGALGCPMLGLKSMMALRGLKAGQTLEIATAGPRAGKALRRVAWMTRSELTSVREEDGRFKFLLRKG